MTTNYNVNITKTAEIDIEEIWQYISQDSIPNAKKFIRSLEGKIHTLENFPQRCPVIPESDLLGLKYRHLIIGNFRIIFKLKKNIVYVMRAVHSARLLKL
ncbi:MAG: type II toxin-antitoxin system RelE/ParE family toxin [Calditrichia bacterium]|nr:type II toxin-antitoxin system RelE/ParE family toxin [Calditrichia bacterium]